MGNALQDTVALVAGATRGAGRAIAVELGAAGATVYCTGRTTRNQQSDVERPETIDETADLVTGAGGNGIAVQVDHSRPAEVRELVARVDAEQGRLDVLVNDIGGEHLMEWHKKVWEVDLDKGLRTLRTCIDTHMITSHFALPLMIRRPGGLLVEVTDGTGDVNGEYYRSEGGAFFDLAKTAASRLAFGMAQELRPYEGTAVALTPGWMRSETMLETFGVTEENWRDATVEQPHFGISETPRFVGRAVAALARDPERDRWNGQSLSSGGLAKEYGFTDVDGSSPDAWRYIAEVQWVGKSADPDSYR